MESLLQDFRYGWRMLLTNPRFTLVAVLTLGLAIGAGTTVFSWIDTVLLHPFPGVEKPQELMAFETTRADGESVDLVRRLEAFLVVHGDGPERRRRRELVGVEVDDVGGVAGDRLSVGVGQE